MLLRAELAALGSGDLQVTLKRNVRLSHCASVCLASGAPLRGPGPHCPVLTLLDGLDQKRHYTVGYNILATKGGLALWEIA